MAVRLGMGDYKQLWKRLTGDRCLTALWPSRHYWGPFSWLGSSVDRHTVVVTGSRGRREYCLRSWLCGNPPGNKGKQSAQVKKQPKVICTQFNLVKRRCKVTPQGWRQPVNGSQSLPDVVLKLARVAGRQVSCPTESRDLWSLSHRGGDQPGLATRTHAKSLIWMQHYGRAVAQYGGDKRKLYPLIFLQWKKYTPITYIHWLKKNTRALHTSPTCVFYIFI